MTSEVLAIALLALGVGAVVLMMFLEVGLSEQRERGGKRSGDGSVLAMEGGGFASPLAAGPG